MTTYFVVGAVLWMSVMGRVLGWSLRVACVIAGFAAGYFDPGVLVTGAVAPRANAQSAVSEKEAFEAAKELGTVEAWDAFLSNYPTGFHADLARAYVKKLAAQPQGRASGDADGVPAAGSGGRPDWCGSPNSSTERAICGNAELSSLDNVLNVAYGRAKFDSPKAIKDIDFEQKRWIGRRNLCGGDAGCIRKRYNEQIQILESYFGN